MTVTEELRRLLDERGVEWTYADGTVSFNDDGRWFHAWAYNDGVMCVSMGYLTPEQAIEATLGRGTCHPEQQYLDTHSDLTVTVCSECGVPTDDLDDCNFCPSCGAKVVE